MKLKFLSFAIIVSSCFLISCKKEAQSTEEKKVINPFFSVEVEASSQKTDAFAMYFSEDGTTVFKDINAVWSGINGGGKSQIIQFKSSDEIVPTHIRLDFGLKKDQDSVVIKSVKFNYYDHIVEFKGSDFFNYFIKNDLFLTKTDAANGTLTILSKDGVYTTPYYYPTQLTIDSIKKITSATK